MRRNSAKIIALGGLMAALAVVIMCLGGLIPIATYVCPMLCCILGQVVLLSCGRRIAWAWYAAVSLLGLMMGPDKEAVVIFLFIGYYPAIKPVLERVRGAIILKLLVFNASIAAAYGILLYVMGMESLAQEYRALGAVGLAVMILLGNVVFCLLDRLLSRLKKRTGAR